ncbi:MULTISPECIES: hypothetical protein [unclassified Paraburkholderia]|nr:MULTISPECIES: hypothetical protein [unclassified Paraburkholderia]
MNQKSPARVVISTHPLRAVIVLNGCKLTEEWVNGTWLCIKAE